MSKKLTPQQRDFVQEAFYRKRNNESYSSIAESLGINRRTLFTYRNCEEGRQIEKELRQKLIDQAFEEIMENVIDKANKGSFQHAKLFMQVTGKLKNEEIKAKQEINITNEVTPDVFAQIDALLQQ
ncbi:phBC6A51 family helix-turn-helix protein [Bacillus bingmayongensis]|uniref:phBC6A51 family helix-turn-helix protein n=1 Tax=Bacillus bingmayongensis TaxID=1150157 RepID=UPI0002E46131|nr:phBC6A51 family helix-turn-helix protein [Bacillus bingmayongensis]